jgi:hypothetical protein
VERRCDAALTGLECSLQPDVGDRTPTGMRQEVDSRYVVTSLEGSPFEIVPGLPGGWKVPCQ